MGQRNSHSPIADVHISEGDEAEECMQCEAPKEESERGLSCRSMLCKECKVKNDEFLEVVERYDLKRKAGESVTDELRLIEEWKRSNPKSNESEEETAP